jgi:hypothetical protein
LGIRMYSLRREVIWTQYYKGVYLQKSQKEIRKR